MCGCLTDCNAPLSDNPSPLFYGIFLRRSKHAIRYSNSTCQTRSFYNAADMGDLTDATDRQQDRRNDIGIYRFPRIHPG